MGSNSPFDNFSSLVLSWDAMNSRDGNMIELRNIMQELQQGRGARRRRPDPGGPPKKGHRLSRPDGTGKTTTIKMIVGILGPDAGTIAMRRQAPRALACKAITTYVPDAPGCFPSVSPASSTSTSSATSTACRLASAANAPGAGWRPSSWRRLPPDPIQTYWLGMRQKIVLTGALIVEPRVFVLDEPMTGLDPRSAHLLKEAMRSHCDRGGTLFFSTHVMEVAEISATASPSSTRAGCAPAAPWTSCAARPEAVAVPGKDLPGDDRLMSRLLALLGAGLRRRPALALLEHKVLKQREWRSSPWV